MLTIIICYQMIYIDKFSIYRYILDDVDRHWDYHDKNSDGFISLTEYQDTSYGVIEGENGSHGNR